jgi:hypothetical protein
MSYTLGKILGNETFNTISRSFKLDKQQKNYINEIKPEIADFYGDSTEAPPFTLGDGMSIPTNENVPTPRSGLVTGNKPFIDSVSFNTNGDGSGSIVNMTSGSYYYPTTPNENKSGQDYAMQTGRFGQEIYWGLYKNYRGQGVKV